MGDYCIAGFGEIMLRLGTNGPQRFSQALPGSLEAYFGGSEANACVSIAALGGKSRFLTALPESPIARACTSQLRGIGCDVDHIHYDSQGRVGVYYVEKGAGMRSTNVIYDRDGSTIALLPPEAYDFASMLQGVTHLHLSGITPALTENAFETTQAIAGIASKMGITISIDMNFRSKLWNWEPGTSKQALAERCLTAIASYADIIIGNDGDVLDIFGVDLSNTYAPDSTEEQRSVVCLKWLANKFPRAKMVVSINASNPNSEETVWFSSLYDCSKKEACFAPMNADGSVGRYMIASIVDRFGGGDSFSGGLLYALNTPELADLPTALAFATANGILKYTFPGDYNFATRDEVLTLMAAKGYSSIKR